MVFLHILSDLNPKPVIIILFLSVFLKCGAQSVYEEVLQYRATISEEKSSGAYQAALDAYNATQSERIAPRMFPLELTFNRIRSLPDSTSEELAIKMAALENLLATLEKKNELPLKISTIYELFMYHFWSDPPNYSQAFILAVRLEKLLEQVSDTQLPTKRAIYVKLGEAYYIFRKYEKSIEVLSDIIDLAPLSFEDNSRMEALRLSGICYANMPGMMQRSDSCFWAMMTSTDLVLNRPMYNALALSNLGCNCMMKRDYDKALALDFEVLDRLKQEKDYGHIAGMYACQGFSYYGKGNYKRLGMVLDSISHYADKDLYNRTKRMKQAYSLRAKYFSAIGQSAKAQLYNDSLLELYLLEEQRFSTQFILEANRLVASDEVLAQTQTIAQLKQMRMTAFVVLLVVLGALWTIIYLYIKKNAAYKLLADRAEEWAEGNVVPPLDDVIEEVLSDADSQGELSEVVVEENRRIIAQLDTMMKRETVYRDSALNLDILSQKLGVHRNLLSRAINNETNMNFNQYINNFRIKEAIKIISKNKEKVYVDELYERVGFSNRTSFYRAFKQITGLSPAEFKSQNEKYNKL